MIGYLRKLWREVVLEAHKNGTQLLIWEDFKTNHYTCKCFGDGDIWGGAVFMGEGSLCGGG